MLRSEPQELWIGDRFLLRGKWAYDTLKFNVNHSKIVAQMPLDQWTGYRPNVLLNNGRPDRAYCYHGHEGGHVFIRDLRSGRVLKKVNTPFHGGLEFNDPLQINNSGDITMCGKDARWILALTEDLALHSIDAKSGKHRIEWRYKPMKKDDTGGGKLIGLTRSSKVLLQSIGSVWEDVPLRIWDQSTRTMQVMKKAPYNGWEGGWGDLAWNTMYKKSPIWNIEKSQQIELPWTDQPIKGITCDSDQSTMFVLRGGGVDVLRIINSKRVQPIHRLASPKIKAMSSISIVLSLDDRTLFCYGRLAKKKGKSAKSDPTVVAVFDVSDLTAM